MKNWTRSTKVIDFCGGCNTLIAPGDPIVVIDLRGELHASDGAVTIITTKQLKIRCARCEGGAPPDLPAVIERAAIIPTQFGTPVSRLPLLFDYKAAQAGREPGEDG